MRSSRNDARALPASGPHSCRARRRIYRDDRAREVDQSPSSRRRRPIAVSVAILAALTAACGRRRRRRGRGKLRWRDGDGGQLCVRPERADRRSRRDAAQRGQRRTQLHDGRSRVDAEAEGEEANVTAPDEAGTQPNPVCVKGRCWGAAGSGPSSGAEQGCALLSNSAAAVLGNRRQAARPLTRRWTIGPMSRRAAAGSGARATYNAASSSAPTRAWANGSTGCSGMAPRPSPP